MNAYLQLHNGFKSCLCRQVYFVHPCYKCQWNACSKIFLLIFLVITEVLSNFLSYLFRTQQAENSIFDCHAASYTETRLWLKDKRWFDFQPHYSGIVSSKCEHTPQLGPISHSTRLNLDQWCRIILVCMTYHSSWTWLNVRLSAEMCSLLYAEIIALDFYCLMKNKLKNSFKRTKKAKYYFFCNDM